MPEGIAVEVQNGFAVIAPTKEKRAEVLSALLANTPVELIEKLTRSGPYVQYRVPEGNAQAAGLLDDPDGVPINRKDLHFGQELKDADPNNDETGVWHHPTEVVKNTIYSAGRDGNNAAFYGPLSPNKAAPVTPPVPPAGAATTSADLQTYVKAASPQPIQYAPDNALGPDGEPSLDWTRAELDSYALAVGVSNPSSLANKQAVLDAIIAAQGS